MHPTPIPPPHDPLTTPLPSTRAPARPVERRRRARGRLRCTSLRIDDIDATTRAELTPALYDIFCESYSGLSLGTVRDELLFRRGGQLYLYRDDRDTIVGFSTVSLRALHVDGRLHSIMNYGVYFRRGTRAGMQAVLRGLLALLRHKLRHPLRPFAYVIEAMTPVSYRRMVKGAARVFPSRHGPTPPQLARVLAAEISRRGLVRSTEHPFVVRYPDPAGHRNAQRITLTPRLRDDPDVSFYLAQNPRFTEGHILCAIAPFGWKDLLRSLSRHLRR